MAIRQMPLSLLDDDFYIPQAIIAEDITVIAQRMGLILEHKTDEMDAVDGFRGAAVVLDGDITFLIKHYAGFQEGTVQLYLPASISDVEDITEMISYVMSQTRMPPSRLMWQRKDNPEL